MFIEIAKLLVPVVILILLGALSVRLGLISRDFVKHGNGALFNVLLPLNLFCGIYSIENFSDIDIMPAVWLTVYSILVIVLGWYYNTKMRRDPETRAVLVQSYVRTNLALFGLSIAMRYYEGVNYDTVILNLMLFVPVTNIMSLVIFELSAGAKVDYKKVILSTMSNNIVRFSLAAVALKILNINLPEIVYAPLENLGNTASPIGLFLIGGGLTFSSLKSDLPYIADSIAWKSIAVPIVGLALTVFMGFSGQSLFVVALSLLSPVAVVSYTYADLYTSKGELAASIVMFTTVASLFSLTAGFYILMSAGLI